MWIEMCCCICCCSNAALLLLSFSSGVGSVGGMNGGYGRKRDSCGNKGMVKVVVALCVIVNPVVVLGIVFVGSGINVCVDVILVIFIVIEGDVNEAKRIVNLK